MNLWLDAFVPAFALLGLGALLRRVLLPLDAVWAGMEKLIYWVLLPSLILSALAALDPSSLPLGAMAFTIWGALATGTLISVLLARFMGHGHAAMTSVLQGGIRFNNLMGFASVGAIFGAEGVSFGAVATGIIVPFVQSVTTLAFALDGSRGRLKPLVILRQLILNPLIIACILGFTVAALGGFPPGVKPTIQALGRASVALGLLCVGAALSWESFTDRLPTQALTGVLKLIGMPAITYALGTFVGLPPLPLAAAVILSSPAAARPVTSANCPSSARSLMVRSSWVALSMSGLGRQWPRGLSLASEILTRSTTGCSAKTRRAIRSSTVSRRLARTAISSPTMRRRAT
jgi:predicted permease